MTLRVEPRNAVGAIPRAAAPLSLAISALMAVAAASGLWWPHLYRDNAWAAGALRGGDLVTLVVATPALVISVVLARRGSAPAGLVWAAMLAYDVYNFTYTVFGTAFNKLFLVHITVLAAAVWALILVAPSLAGLADRFGPRTPARFVAAWCGLVAVILGGMWYLLGSAMVVTSAAYLANLIAAAAFQAHAHVPGVAAVSPVAIVLVAGFFTASIAMLVNIARTAR
jgi:hypothetical protein